MKKYKRAFRRVRRYAPRITVFFKILELGFSKRSYLRSSGFIESTIRNKPVTADGYPLPWFNYNVSQLLDERLDQEAVIFEYGAGSSTEFFSRRAQKVHSIEDNLHWFREIDKLALENVTLMHTNRSDPKGYVESISKPGVSFDVVLIDGLFREQCVKSAPHFLTDSGIVILDDVKGKKLACAKEELGRFGFRSISFRGLKPASPREITTTIFYRDNNTLGI